MPEEKDDIIDIIKSRRSVRKYLEIPVEWDKIVTILEAGKAAPSSGNLQNWKFIIVKDTGTRQKIAECCLQQYWMQDAPIHIIVCTLLEPAKRFFGLRGERLYGIQNSAAAIQNMLLAAHAQGLGACWVGAFEEEMLSTALGIPDNARAQAILTIGYPDEKPPEPAEFPLEFVCFLERYGNRIENIGIWFKDYSEVIKKGLDNTSEFISNKGKEYITKIKDKVEDKLQEKEKAPPEERGELEKENL